MDTLVRFLAKIFGPSVIKKQVASVARHALTLIAGYLAAMGLADDQIGPFIQASEPVLIAIAMYAVAQAWSWVEKATKADEQ